MSDDWKGEHLIRGIRMSTAERHSDDKRVMSKVVHEKRRKEGTNMSKIVQSVNFKKPKKRDKSE